MSDKKFKLYGIYCPKTSELCYVGITVRSLSTRLNEHLRKPTNKNMKLWINQLSNDGLKPNIGLIKHYSTYDELVKEETKYIIEGGETLFNMCEGGIKNYMLGKTHSEESKRKISEALKNRVMSEDELLKRCKVIKELWSNDEWSIPIREQMRHRMVGNKYNEGFHHTDEFKKIKSEQMLNNTFSKGLKHTEEYKKYMSQINSGKNNPNYDKSPTKEVLQERSRKVKEMGTFKGKNNPNFKFDIKHKDLEHLFLIDVKTTKEISDIYGCTTATINKKLRLFKIKRDKPNKYGLNIYEILNHRVNKLTLNQIGDIYGCSGKYISKYIKKHE